MQLSGFFNRIKYFIFIFISSVYIVLNKVPNMGILGCLYEYIKVPINFSKENLKRNFEKCRAS